MTTITIDETDSGSTDEIDAVTEEAEAVEEVAEVVAEAVVESTPDATDAVDEIVNLNHEQRITRIEEQIKNHVTRAELESVRATAWGAQDTAFDAMQVAEEAASDAEVATDPDEVESMIEGTEIVENDEGEIGLDAPSDVPPPGAQQHWAFVDRKTLFDRIGKKLRGDK